jgi:hypothetical protein
MKLLLSNHWHKHEHEKWNAATIRAEYEAGRMEGETVLTGDTADVIFGYIDGDCVGMIVSKERDNERVIITAFEADEEYWRTV